MGIAYDMTTNTTIDYATVAANVTTATATDIIFSLLLLFSSIILVRELVNGS